MDQVFIYDTTLRDGAQAEGISFSGSDKLRIAERLDDMGFAYIEGGCPMSNPRDAEFFAKASKLNFKHAKLAAFGSTRKKDNTVQKDENLEALLQSNAPVATLVGKSWLLHVREVLQAAPDENLDMISESCDWLVKHGREVIFDAEHFFDGYKDNPEYGKQVLLRAASAGVTAVTLCDTNGGTMPTELMSICKEVLTFLPSDVTLGIHCHNDIDMAVANSVLAVRSGVRLVQGTINGFGERAGNANLCSIIPALQLNAGFPCLPQKSMGRLRELSCFVDDLANVRHNPRLPFVGDSAFAHKGGMHVDAVEKDPRTFEHISPGLVGNQRRILVSDLSGKSNLLMKAKEMNLTLSDEQCKKVLSVLKEKESAGYAYEAADASLCVLIHKAIREWNHYFTLEGFRVIVEKRKIDEGIALSEATVKLSVNGVSELMAAEGEGPLNALDLALRKSLERFYPEIRDVHLTDFKVRILERGAGTAAKTRVIIESSDGTGFWTTVGLNENIIQACWEALVDSVEYALYRKNIKPAEKHSAAEGVKTL